MPFARLRARINYLHCNGDALGSAIKEMADPKIRVLCADDHPIVREGIAAIVSSQADMECVAEAGDGEAAIAAYRKHKPDIVVMDLRMPKLGGVEAIARIRAEFPAARIIVLTTYQGDADIHRALDAGAQAYLLKKMVRTELLQTIREVKAGHWHISPPVAALMGHNTPRLTPRELDVLPLMAKGLRNKEIGASLDISEETVKIHIKNILSKLKVLDRTQAVVAASQRGYIQLEKPH